MTNVIRMDNPQVTQTDLAYLAGSMDADGYFSIRRTIQKGGHKNAQYSPRIGFVNSNTLILTKVRQIMDDLNIKYYFKENGCGGFDGSKKQTWRISIETMTNSVSLITAILPYLTGKKFQAECILEYCERRIAVSGINRKGKCNTKKKYTQRDFELVNNVYEANGDIRGTSETIVRDAQRAKI